MGCGPAAQFATFGFVHRAIAPQHARAGAGA
ncbi:hypothetical protein B1M_37996 [Burkholderia sp. TJI49]|nr:hypothetical protein B1M_37996 [Burkholderia sp. TJI49]